MEANIKQKLPGLFLLKCVRIRYKKPYTETKGAGKTACNILEEQINFCLKKKEPDVLFLYL